MAFENIIYEKQDQIAVVKLNRPDKLNALTMHMAKELVSALDDARRDDKVKVVVLKAEGKAFCTGADLKESSNLKTSEEHRNLIEHWQDISRIIERLGKPIIGALHGWVVGGAVDLSTNFDLVVAAENTKWWQADATHGGMAANGFHSKILQIIGPLRAKEMYFTGEPIDAFKAEKWGLVNKVVPLEILDDTVMEMAGKIAGNPQIGIQLTRYFLDHSAEMSFNTLLASEVLGTCTAFASQEHEAGLSRRVKEVTK